MKGLAIKGLLVLQSWTSLKWTYTYTYTMHAFREGTQTCKEVHVVLCYATLPIVSQWHDNS